jgi:hypothetical protein
VGRDARVAPDQFGQRLETVSQTSPLVAKTRGKSKYE